MLQRSCSHWDTASKTGRPQQHHLWGLRLMVKTRQAFKKTNVCPQVIQKDLEDCEAPLTALETLVSSSQSNRTQFERLYADWKHLHTAARVREGHVMLCCTALPIHMTHGIHT